MAYITAFKFELAGEQLSVNVNCNSGGEFSCNLPQKVSFALNLTNKITGANLQEVQNQFYAALKRYKEAETKQELLIGIRYASSGRYSERYDGYPLFSGYRHPYILGGNSTIDNNLDGLGFEFGVIIKETIDTETKYFSATIKGLGNTLLHPELRFKEYKAEDYIKGSHLNNPEKYKMIPFSEVALKTLQNAEEKIRQASELLFNFIEQDEEQILLTLTSQKLLQ